MIFVYLMSLYLIVSVPFTVFSSLYLVFSSSPSRRLCLTSLIASVLNTFFFVLILYFQILQRGVMTGDLLSLSLVIVMVLFSTQAWRKLAAIFKT